MLVAQTLLIEAESFKQSGGWKVDPQFIDEMDSPYLLAHGIGKPVQDAVTEFTIEEPGVYHCWVRTKNWISSWDLPYAPGKFQIKINDKNIEHIFGTVGKNWHWEYGGSIKLKKGKKIPYYPGEPFRSYARFHKVSAPYPFPYRCLYSRNIENLFMAGRNISVTHTVLGTVGVQSTTGMMGEVVGIAAGICKKYNCTPRAVYQKHLL